jgi:cathepsin B
MKFSTLSFASVAVAAVAQEVHQDRAKMIEEINNTPGVLWKAAAHPRFATLPPGGSSSTNGVKVGSEEALKAAIASGEIERFVDETNADIPDTFDSETNWPECAKVIGDIRDQSMCGCCWAFGGAEAASDRMCIATKAKMMVPLSAQDVCFNANPNGCGGGFIQAPWSYIKESGAVTGGQYKGTGPFGKGLCSSFSMPHCHHHGPQGKDPYPAEGTEGCPNQHSPQGPRSCDADAQAPHNNFQNDKYTFSGTIQSASGEEDIQKMIMSGGPVETAFTVYSDFENYAGGIYHHVSGSMAGGHAVKMVGWGVENGQKYWKVANSWNPYWGEKGYFRIRRGNNEGGIESSVVGSAAGAKWTTGSEGAVVV